MTGELRLPKKPYQYLIRYRPTIFDVNSTSQTCSFLIIKKHIGSNFPACSCGSLMCRNLEKVWMNITAKVSQSTPAPLSPYGVFFLKIAIILLLFQTQQIFYPVKLFCYSAGIFASSLQLKHRFRCICAVL